MKYRSRTAAPEPSTPLTVYDRHAAAAFHSLLDDKPLLQPLREAVYGPWMRPLHAVAVAYAAGGQAAAAVTRFTQLARRNRGLHRLLSRCAAEPAPKHKLADLLAAPVPWQREVVPGLAPAADQTGLFSKTITLARPFGRQGATLALSDYPRPIALAKHPDLKHETLGTAA